MAEFCEECNKPKAPNKQAAILPVYCRCAALEAVLDAPLPPAEVMSVVQSAPKSYSMKVVLASGLELEISDLTFEELHYLAA